MDKKKNNLKYVKKLKGEFKEFDKLFDSYLEKIKKEHNKTLIEQMSNLINEIALGENIDEVYLRDKYLNIKSEKKEKKKVSEQIEIDLLDHITIDNNTYWYQNKEDGNIYDLSCNIIGKYSNKEFLID